jgi:hypothetical protein
VPRIKLEQAGGISYCRSVLNVDKAKSLMEISAKVVDAQSSDDVGVCLP